MPLPTEWRENMVGWSYLSLPAEIQVWVTKPVNVTPPKWSWFVEDSKRRRVLVASEDEKYDNDVDAKHAALLRLHEVYGERQSLIARLIGEVRKATLTRGRYPSFPG